MSKKEYAVLNFRVTPEMKELITKRAKQTGLGNISAYVRQLIYRDLKRHAPEEFATVDKTRTLVNSDLIDF